MKLRCAAAGPVLASNANQPAVFWFGPIRVSYERVLSAFSVHAAASSVVKDEKVCNWLMRRVFCAARSGA
jgi:hypothetical protein